MDVLRSDRFQHTGNDSIPPYKRGIPASSIEYRRLDIKPMLDAARRIYLKYLVRTTYGLV
jgi:hypothetical protein